MPFYHRMGNVPPKRHTQFRRPDGALYREQVMGTKGFSGIQSILYHHDAPTEIAEAALLGERAPRYEAPGPLRHRHFRTAGLAAGGDAVEGRRYVLGNEDVRIAVASPTEAMAYYYRNGDGDELLFVREGEGAVETMFGTLRYGQGDYIVLPVGTIYRVVPDEGAGTRLLVVETNSWLAPPKRYRNDRGQLLEHSPYCERDIRPPGKLETFTDEGEFEVRLRKDGRLHAHVYARHPLNVVGWDGYLYPWILNISDFEPITGRVHQPPPVHQTFEGDGFVVCSFCPRLYDYHPQAIPAPYAHSNVDSDEVLYYVRGHFGSRKGIEEGSLTLHPAGIPHGPHPGKAEASIGKKETTELAVMIDTFRPLRVAEQALGIEDGGYARSWLTTPPQP